MAVNCRGIVQGATMGNRPVLLAVSSALETAESKAWASNLLLRELEGATELWGTEDDAWIWHGLLSANASAPWSIRYCANGLVYSPSPRGMMALRWKSDDEHSSLARNAKMVGDFADLDTAFRSSGIVIALFAAWARTCKAEHIVTHARSRGLVIREFTCPEEFSPKGGA
jgi:hypothetical protein